MRENEGWLEARKLAYSKQLPDPATVQVVDFFCGCGGLSWAFENTRQSHLAFRVLAGIDIDENALATYSLNCEGRAVQLDVRKIESNPSLLSECVPEFNPKSPRPLVFVGGPPCQGFSAHRKKDHRDDDRNDLVVVFARICAHFKPDVLVLENVPEMLDGRRDSYYLEARSILLEAGYNLREDVLDLSVYGVPQARQRAIVLGSVSRPIDMVEPLLDEASVLTVRRAIEHLRPIAAGETDPADPNHRAPNHTKRILDRIRRTPPDGGDRRDLPRSAQLECHRQIDVSHTPGFTDVYGRLYWDRPSVTITAKSSTPSCGRFLHPEQDRNISVREAAILQGFPQSFEFVGPFTHQYRQVGEAVPPSFARHVAWAILDHLKPEESRWPTVRSAIAEHGSGGDKNSTVCLVDAFCGAGGLSLGFEAAGFESVLGFDTDPDAVATYRRNLSVQGLVADVRDPEIAAEIKRRTGGRSFVICGGPPCQGFSQQRRGADDDKRNNLVVSYAALVRRLEKKPLAVVLENVTYLDSPRGRAILSEFENELSDLGYHIFRHDLNSAEFGIPQLRHRIILVALQESLAGLYRGPSPVTPSRWVTVGEALSGLPDPRKLQGPSPVISNHAVAAEGPDNVRRIAYVDAGLGRMCIPEDIQLDCHIRYGGHLDVYGRLDWFGQARTITGGFDSFTRGEYGHPIDHRSITHREGARLQGFPDWFAFVGNKNSVRRQIGNAVPPGLAYAVALAIKEAKSAMALPPYEIASGG